MLAFTHRKSPLFVVEGLDAELSPFLVPVLGLCVLQCGG